MYTGPRQCVQAVGLPVSLGAGRADPLSSALNPSFLGFWGDGDKEKG